MRESIESLASLKEEMLKEECDKRRER